MTIIDGSYADVLAALRALPGSVVVVDIDGDAFKRNEDSDTWSMADTSDDVEPSTYVANFAPLTVVWTPGQKA